MKNISRFTLKIAFGILCISVLTNCDERKAKRDFVKNFDLKLVGEVIDIKMNNYGQHLICLKVLKSNKKKYFPIHNPNKFKSGDTNLWEKRFFIKVDDSLATLILANTSTSLKLTHQKIKKGTRIEVNKDGEKAYDIIDSETQKSLGGIYISTSPVRDNIEKSCLSIE